MGDDELLTLLIEQADAIRHWIGRRRGVDAALPAAIEGRDPVDVARAYGLAIVSVDAVCLGEMEHRDRRILAMLAPRAARRGGGG